MQESKKSHGHPVLDAGVLKAAGSEQSAAFGQTNPALRLHSHTGLRCRGSKGSSWSVSISACRVHGASACVLAGSADLLPNRTYNDVGRVSLFRFIQPSAGTMFVAAHIAEMGFKRYS